MPTLLLNYSVVSRLISVLLIGAGLLKARQMFSSTPGMVGWIDTLTTLFNLLFGAWLLFGLVPRWSRILTLFCFLAYLHINLFGAVQGKSSCGCFGEVTISPWITATLDALVVICLLLSTPSKLTNLTFKDVQVRIYSFGILALILTSIATWPILKNLQILSAEGKDTDQLINLPTNPTASKIIIEKILERLDQNHAALHSIKYTEEINNILHPIKGVSYVRGPGGPSFEPVDLKTDIISTHARKVILRGDNVRYDYRMISSTDTSCSGSEGFLVGIQGKRIGYDAGFKTGSIQTSECVDSNMAESLDLRCAGFIPPFRKIGDFVRAANVIEMENSRDISGNPAVRFRLTAQTLQNQTEDLTVFFVPSMNYLPTRIIRRYTPTGGISMVEDIEYTFIESVRAWFPKLVKTRLFLRDTTSDPETPFGQNATITRKVVSFENGDLITDDDFDPEFPPNSIILGDLATASRTDDVAIKASSIMLGEPKELTGSVPPQINFDTKKFAILIFITDGLLLIFCYNLRNRIQF